MSEQAQEARESRDPKSRGFRNRHWQGARGTAITLISRKNALRLGVKAGEGVALCLSGGGIRSATFSLGVIQALARHGWLKKFTYLSTVSGGGYIGSWLSSWIRRTRIVRRGRSALRAETRARSQKRSGACAPAATI